MRGKTFKLIYFSLGGSEVKEINLAWKNVIFISIGATAALGMLLMGILALFTDFFQDITNKNLAKNQFELSLQLEDMGKKISEISTQIDKLQQADTDLRIFVDMQPFSDDVSTVGTGGPAPDYTTRVLQDPLLLKADQINALIENATDRIRFLEMSREKIQFQSDNKKNQFNHTPSIAPVLDGYRITDYFGLRVHPVTGKFGTHEGLDLSGRRGDPVYATANGIVEYVNNNPRRSSFGRMVRVNHGFGLVTVYAHLNRINVKVGDTIDRFYEIGEVGDSGRTTGPHLHYEVIKNNTPVNPLNYIFDRKFN